jgi:hypothetical protein
MILDWMKHGSIPATMSNENKESLFREANYYGLTELVNQLVPDSIKLCNRTSSIKCSRSAILSGPPNNIQNMILDDVFPFSDTFTFVSRINPRDYMDVIVQIITGGSVVTSYDNTGLCYLLQDLEFVCDNMDKNPKCNHKNCCSLSNTITCSEQLFTTCSPRPV